MGANEYLGLGLYNFEMKTYQLVVIGFILVTIAKLLL